MASSSFSSAYLDLDEVAKKRYIDKLELIGGGTIDPYVTRSAIQCCDENLFPAVEWPDIFNYLISAPSPYTQEELKAWNVLKEDDKICILRADKGHAMVVMNASEYDKKCTNC